MAGASESSACAVDTMTISRIEITVGKTTSELEIGYGLSSTLPMLTWGLSQGLLRYQICVFFYDIELHMLCIITPRIYCITLLAP